MRALPPTAGSQGAGGPVGAHRRPRTINEAAYPNAVILDHPVAFYRLDDTGSTMVDSGPNGLNGTYGSAVTRGATSLVPNTIDPAAAFPGGAWSANGIATVAQSSTLQPTSVSIEAWVSENVVNSGGTVDLVSYGSQSGGQGYTLQLTSSNTLEVWLKTSGGAGTAQAVGSTVLTPGAAYHVVATYDGSNANLYVNGVLDGSFTGGSAISYAGIGSYGLSIGESQSTSRVLFNGTIDDVSIFNAALTSTQAASHYAAAMSFPDDPYALQVMTDNPSAYYRLDDAGAKMYDATNNRINGSYGSGITKRATGLLSNSADTAATFPGGSWSANSIATVPQNTLLQPTALSIEAWVKETAVNSGGTVDLVSYGPQTGQAYSLQISASNAFVFAMSSTGTPSSVSLTGSTTLSAGTIYHVVATFDGTTARIYVNGSQNVTTSATGNVSYSGISTYGLALGATQSTTRSVFNGTLDEVAIYDHALSAGHISSHYGTSSWTASQSGPAHILTAAYYEPGKNSGVSLQYMLRHVDWAVTQGTDYSLAASFRASGGSHAMWYTDPVLIYTCNSPFGPTSQNTPGSCGTPLGTALSSDDSAWQHASGATTSSAPACYAAPAGARLHGWSGGTCSTSSTFLYKEAPYMGSSHAQSAYATYTSGVTSANSFFDVTWMDDGSPLYTDFLFTFGATSAEYDSLGATTYRNDMIAMACKASKPVIFNGPSWDALDSTNGPAQKASVTAMLQSPCVLGGEVEGAFVTLSGRKNLNQQNEKYTFIPIADNILLVQSLQKFALIDDYTGCSYGSSGCTFDPVGDRIYNLGGLWLIYDPRYTLAWNQIDPGNGDPFMTDGDGNFDGLVAEYNIVPTQPYQTATGTDITTLQIADGHTAGGSPAGGAFRREFAQCYQNGSSIGRCAVVLNPESSDYTSGGVVTIPTLAHSYSSALVLDNLPADAGGSATWTTTLPTTLQPMTAVILKQ